MRHEFQAVIDQGFRSGCIHQPSQLGSGNHLPLFEVVTHFQPNLSRIGQLSRRQHKFQGADWLWLVQMPRPPHIQDQTRHRRFTTVIVIIRIDGGRFGFDGKQLAICASLDIQFNRIDGLT